MLNAEAHMRSASLIKLPILVHGLSEVVNGKLSLETRYSVQKEEQVGGAGILHTLSDGLMLTLQDLLTLMIVISDNTATNKLITLLGEANLNAFMQSLGLSQTSLVGRLQLPEALQSEAQKRGETNRTCATDILGLLIRLEKGDLLPPAQTKLALDILKKQQFTEALSRYLPRDKELYPGAITVASKSGCLRGLWHDAGIIYKGGQASYALVIMTDEAADRSYSYEQEGMMLIAKLSKAIFEELT